jgi:hypothetical protein
MRSIKNIIAVFAAAVLLASCEKKSYVAAFDELPQERVAKQIDSVRTILTGAANGWVGILATGTGGGFGFYMEFDNQENVKMVADLTNTSATEMKTSRYRVRQDAGVALTFDTYNYISMLNSPDPTIFGGTVRDGFRSDIDFIYDHATADSIIFVGKRYRQLFKLVKATADQKARYGSGAFRPAIEGFKNYFITNFNNYINVGDIKVAVLPAFDSTLATGKRLTFIGVSGNSTKTSTRKLGFAIDNFIFADNDTGFLNKRFTHTGWKNANTLAVYDAAGAEYVVQQSAQPFINFSDVFAYNLFYNSIFASTGSLPPGVVSDFNAVYSALVARFNASGRVIRDFEVKLNNSNTLAIRMNYYATSAPASVFLAEALSAYTIQDGIIRLSGSLSINGNWNTRATQIGDFGTFFQGKSFKPDWVSSSVPGLNLGGLYRVDQPTAFVYGVVRKS